MGVPLRGCKRIVSQRVVVVEQSAILVIVIVEPTAFGELHKCSTARPILCDFSNTSCSHNRAMPQHTDMFS